MAKAKQKKTMQEMLEEAIVPKDQAPFAIPENWCLVKLSYVCGLQNGEKSKGEFLPYLDAKYLRGKSDGEYKNEGVILNAGQKVILVDGENSGEVFDIFERGYMGSTFRILSVAKNVMPDLIKYFIAFNQENLRNNKVGSAIPHLNKTIFYNLMFPLAPLSEQKRIVDKIESLFSRLDEAKDLIQKSLDEFEDRKSAILYKALKGDLIVKKCNWREVRLKDVVYDFQYGTSKKSEKSGKAVVVRMGNLQSGKIDWTDLVYSNDKEDISKYTLQKGDILFNRTNSAALVGKTSIFEDDRLAIFAGYLIRLKYDKNKVIGKFLNYVMNSHGAKEYCSKVKTDAVNQSNINAKKIAEFSFKLPTIEEQQEIVCILDNFFEKEDKSKELLNMIDQIEEMKKSILARAFRGQLGTHSDDDEPAIELVKKILIEDNNVHCDKLEITKGKYKVREKKQMSKTILEALLSNGNKTTPEKLKQETGLTIDEFYERLKELVDLNKVREIKEEGESYLEVIDEDRPFKN